MTGKSKGVHITAGSFEYDRILLPILDKYPVHKLIHLTPKTSKYYPKARELTQHYVEKLKENPIDVEIIKVDIYEFDDVFKKTSEILMDASHEEYPIYLNISSAPKLALVAMISAAFLSNNKNIEIFYASPEEYMIPNILGEIKEMDNGGSLERLKELKDKFLENGSAIGISDYVEIPIFPLEKVSEIDEKIIKTLHRCGGVSSIKELMEKLKKRENIDVERSTLQYRIKNLEDLGLIESQRQERRLTLQNTKMGEIYIKGC